MEKRRRLEAIWEKAGMPIGCERVPEVEYEAKVMVEGLKQIRAMIKETENKLAFLRNYQRAGISSVFHSPRCLSR